jgi:hypothetical protein
MSLVMTYQTNKQNKTTDKSNYYKKYRENNLEHLRNLERCKYYKKKYNLEQPFIELFGEYSGDVYKIIKDFNEVKTKCPILACHILSELSK